MSKKSKNPRKGRQETPEVVQSGGEVKQKGSKLLRYEDLLVAPSSDLYKVLTEEKDEAKAAKIYKEQMKEWKTFYGDFDPAAVNQKIRETFWPWNGDYEKTFYDVLRKTGEPIVNCWPNDGKMMAINGSGSIFTIDDVLGIRIAINPPH